MSHGATPYNLITPSKIQTHVSLRYEATATLPDGSTIELEVKNCTTTFDETWSPRTQGTLVCPLADQATVDALDPRRVIQVEIRAGYSYSDVAEAKQGNQAMTTSHVVHDVHRLAVVFLRDISENLPENTMTLTVASAECFLQDYRSARNPPQTGAVEAIQWLIDEVFDLPGFTPANVITTVGAGYGATYLTDWTVPVGVSFWEGVEEVGARCGVRTYVNSDGDWVIETSGTEYTDIRHTLQTGPGPDGNIITTAGTISRENTWYNHVDTVYEWTDSAGAARYIRATAQLWDPPFAPAYVGASSYIKRSSQPVTQAAADQVAANILRKVTTLGRSRNVEAVAALWLRAAHRVQVKVRRPGDGTEDGWQDAPWETLTVRAVTHEFPTGRMYLQLRDPNEINES